MTVELRCKLVLDVKKINNMTVLPYYRIKADSEVVLEKVIIKVMNLRPNKNISHSQDHQSATYDNVIDTDVHFKNVYFCLSYINSNQNNKNHIYLLLLSFLIRYKRQTIFLFTKKYCNFNPK